MFKVTLNEADRIVLLEPDVALTEADFIIAASTIDPFIEKTGKLNGIIIHTERFPGWDSFPAMIKHVKFVKDHHKKIARVALVTDSPIGELGEHIASHFISAEIKHFAYTDMDEARNWILNSE